MAWKSEKQNVVARSSKETKFIANGSKAFMAFMYLSLQYTFAFVQN